MASFSRYPKMLLVLGVAGLLHAETMPAAFAAAPTAQVTAEDGGTYLDEIIARSRTLLGDKDRDPATAARMLKEAAAVGSVEAMFLLADLYQSGEGIPKDYPSAIALLHQAINAGALVRGTVGLASLYRHADAPFRDFAKAVDAYQKAVDLGDAGAMVGLAGMLGAGEGIAADFDKAESLLRSAIAKGAAVQGWAGLAELYRQAAPPKRDPAKAADAYQRAADLGDPWSMVALAQMLVSGDGIPRDFDRAKSLLDTAIAVNADIAKYAWSVEGDLFRTSAPDKRDAAKAMDAYQKAVDLGNANALVSQARMLGWGDGVDIDFDKAVVLLNKAIESGAAVAGWSTLANLYQQSDAPHRDPAKAIDAFEQAANLGDTWSMLSLGQILGSSGDPANFDRAKGLLTRGIEAGGDVAKYAWGSLGDLYRRADAGHRDPAQAINAYQKAVDLGSPSAMIGLGQMLASGDGVPADFDKGKALLQRAIASGAPKDGWAALAALYRETAAPNRDLQKAADAYQHAADLGDPWSMLALGQMMSTGDGIPVDVDKAKTLLDGAVAAGLVSPAAMALGDLYAHGPEQGRDLTLAAKYYETAAAAGNGNAHLAAAQLGEGTPSSKRQAMVEHLKQAAKILGANTVAKAMFNFRPSLMYAAVQELLTEAGQNAGNATGVFGKQTQMAIRGFCSASKIADCDDSIITTALLEQLLLITG